MPAPIMPAPSTPIFVICGLADAVRPRAAAVDVLQVEEERLDHVLGDLPGDQLGEVAALDAAGGVEVHLRTLDGRVEDGARRRHRRTLELLLQQRRERRQDAGQSRRRRSAAGHLVALGIPRLGVAVGVGLDPRLGGGHQFVAPSAALRRPGPISLALPGLKRVPWLRISMNAFWMPNMRTVRVTPPPPGSRPSVTSGKPTTAPLHVGDDPVVARRARSPGRRRARRR